MTNSPSCTNAAAAAAASSSSVMNRRMNSIHSSRASLATLTEDCPICLDEMQVTDLEHPLQCTIHCGFNMCKNCIESLLTSSKDDYQEASDGNRHVKVFLRCPNCRSDLSHTIRDTLLLRKADEIFHQRMNHSHNDDELKDNSDGDDSVNRDEWTTSQIRLERAMHTAEVQQAIKQARIMEAEYLGKDFLDDWLELHSEDDEEDSDCDHMDSSRIGESENFSSSYVEEWGFEADIDIGVHTSFRMPRPPKPLVRAEAIRIDPTLFGGLDYFLTEEQRLEVTELMTSGDPSRLAKAAEILQSAAQHLLRPSQRQQRAPNPTTGGTLSNSIACCNTIAVDGSQKPPLAPKRASSSDENKATNRRKSVVRRSSVFELIAEAEAAHDRGSRRAAHKSEEKKASETLHEALRSSPYNPAGRSRVAHHRQLERELQIQADFQKRFPIPVRMPKAIEIDATLPFDMEFVDYTWNGTVIDAYSKISIGFRNHVKQRTPNNVNVINILGAADVGEKSTVGALGCAIGLCNGDDFATDEVHIALPGEARVLISHTGRSGKQGAVRGDVVTHVDGQSVADRTVSEFLVLLNDRFQHGNETVTITLNAERSVAEAIKRRAIAIAEML